MRAMGYKKGYPDITIFHARHGYHSLLIELKSATGKISEEQKEWKKRLIEEGYKAEIMPLKLNLTDGLNWLTALVSSYMGDENELQTKNLYLQT